MDDHAPTGNTDPASDLAADLHRLHEAGTTTLPATALAQAAAATGLHRRRDDLRVLAASLEHEAPRAVADLLGLVQDGLGASARACDATGRALVGTARRYAASDDATAAAFATLVATRTPVVPVPDAPFRPPPGSGDPAPVDHVPAGPRDAA